LLSQREDLEAYLRDLWTAPATLDLDSPAQLGGFFKHLGWEEYGVSKAGGYLTADDQLQHWSNDGMPGASELQELRSMKTILKTFISATDDSTKGWAQYLRDHDDGTVRMHPVFNVMRTESGRCKCNSPNMQNVPARGDLAILVKKCLSSPDPENYYLCTMDFASIQIRLAAVDTMMNICGRDENLYNVYLDPKMGGDMHSRTAFSVFCEGRRFDLDVIDFETEEGRNYSFYADEMVKVKGKGKIHARDITAEDVIEF
jgi:DNA polymerase I-like protein with 3'-5' exonuclease and polymerase domains